MITIRISEKQVFILKAILGTILALNAGNYLALRTDVGFDRTFFVDSIYWFFPFLCLVIMQWILSSEYLHKGWVFAGIVGCVLVIFLDGIIYFYVPKSVYHSYFLQVVLLTNFLMGFVATIPQGLLMKNRDGLLWVLANSIGWAFSFLYSNTHFHLFQPIQSILLMQTLIYHTYNIPLGLLVGLSLYSIKVNYIGK